MKDIALTLHKIVSRFIRLSVLVALITALIQSRWTIFMICLLSLVLTFLPTMIEKRFHVYITTELEFIIVLFIYASLFLGEVHGYYTRFWWWDVVLHVGSGIALGILGFILMYVLHYEGKIDASPSLIALFSFCFAMAFGAVWEIFEFSMDQIFLFNMQKSGLLDTMWDLIVDALGALLVAILGYFYVRGNTTPLFSRLMKRFVKKNPKLFRRKIFKIKL